MPGFNLNYYKNGKFPCHTKQFFTDFKILTVQSIILCNILKFMYKYHHWQQYMPSTLAKIISSNAPLPGHSLENCKAWLNSHSSGIYRNVLSFKGPLFYLKYMTEILENHSINSQPGNTFKNKTKSLIFSIQSSGSNEEWEGKKCHYIVFQGYPETIVKTLH